MGGRATKGSHSDDRGNAARCSSLAQQIRQLSAEVAELGGASTEPITEMLSHWLSAHYVAAARTAAEEAGGEGIALQKLRELTADVVALRKGDHSAARLAIEREWVEIERGKARERMESQFEEWLKEPGTNQRLCGKGLSPEEREGRLREIFKLPEKGRGGISPETRDEIERALGLL